MNTAKINFLKGGFIHLVRSLSPDTKPKWGAMNAQQMIEHLSDSVRIANGKTQKKLLTPPEKLPAFRDFMMSEKPFKPNTKNAEMSDIPPAYRNPDMQTAIEELKKEFEDFFDVFEKNKTLAFMNPFFGKMNFDEWVQLMHKHAVHHAKQFGLME